MKKRKWKKNHQHYYNYQYNIKTFAFLFSSRSLRLFSSSCYLFVLIFIRCYLKKSKKFDLTFESSKHSNFLTPGWLQLFPAVDYKIRGWLQDPRFITDSRLISRKNSGVYGDVGCDYTNHVIIRVIEDVMHFNKQFSLRNISPLSHHGLT